MPQIAHRKEKYATHIERDQCRNEIQLEKAAVF